MINKQTVLEALNSNFKYFEDALQNFSAKNEKGIEIIVTRNIKDYKASELSVMTPNIPLLPFSNMPYYLVTRNDLVSCRSSFTAHLVDIWMTNTTV